MPLVSVVVPTHNRPEFLAEALASARAQTFTDYEIIVVSNGESDAVRRESFAAATAHEARYFTLPKGNLSAARNFAIDQANGEWIAFLDDDDLWLPEKLERQLAEAERTGADMIASDYVEVRPDREIRHQPRPVEGWTYLKSINHLLWWANPSAVIIRKSAIDEVGGFDSRQLCCEDNDLWRRVLRRYRVCQMDEVLMRYRQGHSSIMQQKRRRYLYDLRYYIKMHFDTPPNLRDTLPGFDFFWNRTMLICFPKWIVRDLEITTWGGIQRWPSIGLLSRLQEIRYRLRLRTRWIAFKRMLRPRTRLNELRYHLRLRTRAKALFSFLR